MCDRVEKMLMTTGTIAYDHLQSMMALPTYTTIIMPHIKRVRDLLLRNNVAVSPLLDELLIPNNIIHRMDNILPELATGDFTPDNRLAIANANARWGAMGTERIFLQHNDEKFEPNPKNLTPDQVKAADPLRLAEVIQADLKLLGAPKTEETPE
jgi:hypothetical protein